MNDVPLEPGVTLLERPSMRSAALHQLLVDELASDRTRRTLWVDARDNANTQALYKMAPDAGLLDGVRIARAYTAYQHHTLVKRVVEQARQRPPDLVVAPCTASLYRDDELDAQFGRDLFTSSMAVLTELADALSVPVLVTTTGASADLEELLVDHADTRIHAQETSQGLRYVGDDVETTVYWQDGWMQTTLTYWVDLFGWVCDLEPSASQAGLEAFPAP